MKCHASLCINCHKTGRCRHKAKHAKRARVSLMPHSPLRDVQCKDLLSTQVQHNACGFGSWRAHGIFREAITLCVSQHVGVVQQLSTAAQHGSQLSQMTMLRLAMSSLSGGRGSICRGGERKCWRREKVRCPFGGGPVSRAPAIYACRLV